MENNEILNALAQSMTQIVNKEVEKRTEDSVNLKTLIGDLKAGSLKAADVKELYDAIIDGYGNNENVVTMQSVEITPTAIVSEINNTDSDLTTSDVLDELSTEESTEFNDYVLDKGFVNSETIDEDWINENVDDSLLREVVKDYVAYNL